MNLSSWDFRFYCFLLSIFVHVWSLHEWVKTLKSYAHVCTRLNIQNVNVCVYVIILHVHVCVLLCVDNSYSFEMHLYYYPCVAAGVGNEDEYLIT